MTSIQKKMLAIVVIVALVSTIGYGVYHYATQPPSVKFTTVDFKVNYNGNYSNYLEPVLLAPNGTAISNNLISSAYSDVGVFKNSGDTSWHTFFFLHLIRNLNTPNNTLYKALKNYGYVFNDSAVIDSITSTTPGLSVNSVGGGSNIGVPFPIDPTYGSLIVVRLNVDTMYYHGPLNITINASAPAQNILIYRPNLTIQYNGNSISPTSSGGLSLNGLALPSKNTYATVASRSLNFSVELIDQNNFTVTGITVSKPFSVPSQSYSEPGQGYSEQNGTRTYSGPYVDVVSFSLIPPKGPFSGNLNITIQVR